MEQQRATIANIPESPLPQKGTIPIQAERPSEAAALNVLHTVFLPHRVLRATHEDKLELNILDKNRQAMGSAEVAPFFNCSPP